jgi:hypothetical protein
MAALHVDPDIAHITPAQSLTGWRREFCIEVLEDDGTPRIFVRAVETSSFKAAELKRGVLFHRVDPRFTDLPGCVAAIQRDLERLIDTARRVRPDKDNLFAALTYNRDAWERVQRGIDRWVRR